MNHVWFGATAIGSYFQFHSALSATESITHDRPLGGANVVSRPAGHFGLFGSFACHGADLRDYCK
ncbi:MAG TPA: hypothetical protein VHV08_08650, partial [Pirellulales bacterium]|nr:hypothetical protein [Pirellulales bacterium]